MSDAAAFFPLHFQPLLDDLVEMQRVITSRFRHILSGILIVVITLVSGCALVPISLTAPPTGASCPDAVGATSASDAAVLDPKGMVKKARDAANNAPDGATLLAASLQYVRNDASYIHPVVLDLKNYMDPQFPEAVINEAAILVRKNIAAKTAADNKTKVADEDVPDPVEGVLLANLPHWAQQPGTLLPITALVKQLAQNSGKALGEVIDNTNDVIGLIAKNKAERNTLVGQMTGSTTPAQNQPTTDNLGNLVLASISDVQCSVAI